MVVVMWLLGHLRTGTASVAGAALTHLSTGFDYDLVVLLDSADKLLDFWALLSLEMHKLII